jgi:hypothetical protein
MVVLTSENNASEAFSDAAPTADAVRDSCPPARSPPDVLLETYVEMADSTSESNAMVALVAIADAVVHLDSSQLSR